MSVRPDPIRARLPLLAAGALLVVAACGGSTASSSPTPSPSVPASPSGSPSTAPSPSPSPAVSLVLRVTSEGGFIGPTATLAALPMVSVYSDGTIIVPGPVDAIYPGPALIPLLSRSVGATGAAGIQAAIHAAGLDQPSSAGPGIPGDAGMTVFTVQVGDQTVVTRLTGGGAPGVPGVGGGDPARAAAFALLARLSDPTDAFGGSAGPQTTFVPTAYRVFVVPGGPVGDPQVSQSPQAWPLSTPLDAFGAPAVPDRGIAGLRSGIVQGADVATFAPFAQRLNTLSPVASGGRSYTLYLRALLPDELTAGGA